MSVIESNINSLRFFNEALFDLVTKGKKSIYGGKKNMVSQLKNGVSFIKRIESRLDLNLKPAVKREFKKELETYKKLLRRLEVQLTWFYKVTLEDLK